MQKNGTLSGVNKITHLRNINRKLLIFSSILFSFLLLECDDEKKNDCNITACTDEFRSIAVSIKHISDNSAFILTDYKVIRMSDNKDITFPDINLSDNNGYYQIANDNSIDLFRFNNTEVEFNGYFNDILVIQKRLIITADCCHISLVSGETAFLL